jgi:8-oxo-dGTP pyrophosphatase MutT (NUDIX family)
MNATTPQRPWPPLSARLFHFWLRLSRPMTLGMRGVVYDQENHAVFLVRHTYVKGWHFPGGGVEPGESTEAALARELVEEGNIELLSRPELKSFHFNRMASNRDHVAVSARHTRMCLTVRSPRRGSSRWTHCPPVPAKAPVAALPRYLRTRPSRTSGRSSSLPRGKPQAAFASRSRLCGAARSSSGPRGTTPLGLIVLWLP